MRALAAVLCVGAFAPAGLAQTVEDPIVVTMHDALPHLDRYRALPAEDRDRFHLRYCVEGGMVAPEEVAVRVRIEGTDAPLPLDAEGCLDPLPEPALYDRNPLVIVNQARGEAEVVLYVTPTATLRETMDVGALRASAGQANRALRERAGPLALLLPRFGGVLFEWDGPAPMEAYAVLDTGDALTLPVVYDRAYFRPSVHPAFREATTLHFGRPPVRASLIP